MGTSAFTGMVADFIAPVVPAGWLELDGSTISTSTFSALYGTMAIQTSGTRTNGSPIVTSISSTSTFKAGYFVFGTGIAAGTTIITVDSGTQITLSNNASSSGTASFAVSPWVLNTGTITLPNVTTSGRYRRSRTSTTAVGQLQADTFASHTHGVSGSTGTESADHSHFTTISGTTGTMNSNTSHTHGSIPAVTAALWNPGGGSNPAVGNFTTTTTAATNIDHTHGFSAGASSGGVSASHFHNLSTTSAATGATETRPVSLVVITCVKT